MRYIFVRRLEKIKKDLEEERKRKKETRIREVHE